MELTINKDIVREALQDISKRFKGEFSHYEI